MTLRIQLRDRAQHAFQKAVAAADPAKALARAVEHHPLPSPPGATYIIAIGKAAVGMARTALSYCDTHKIAAAIAITNYENAQTAQGIDVLTAAHPVPDEKGAQAAARVISLLKRAQAEDLVIVLVSGGSSALLPAPITGVSLSDKIALNQVLLASGLEIGEMNVVRQAVSDLKGGGMLRYAQPARVISYVLSDVLGDDLRLVGSGPSLAPAGSLQDAKAILKARALWDSLPDNLRKVIERPQTAFNLKPEAYLIGGNKTSLREMARAAKVPISEKHLVGDVQAAAKRIVNEARSAGNGLAFGGETTVILKGNGMGGRNQELAIRVALESQRQQLQGPWAFLSGGTDGRDGPTDAAGGLVDDQTIQRLQNTDLNIQRMLENNDCYHLLKASGDLLQIPATGTNVADLQVFLRA